MFAVISGTNRPGSQTRKVAQLVTDFLAGEGHEARLLDLQELPPEVFSPDSYAAKPAGFAPFQEAITDAQGVITLVPEYNGSFPGALKYFVDMLRFPESLVGTPSCFVGLAAGRWGGLRAVEHMEQVFHYRRACLYGERLYLPDVFEALDAEGRLGAELQGRLETLLRGFVAFAERLAG
ncbi:MAG: NAD(P)H-dependent oxidoreductase [Planctomycetes bacterium]|nr:NAD(P)H-dependent oxidoreductase [Planctomycetota bacterium]